MPRVAPNTVWLLLGRLSSQGLSFLLALVIARRLGAAALGQYSFVVALVFVGNVFTTFGLDTLLIRALASDDRDGPRLVGAALRAQLLLSALYVVFVWVAVNGLTASPQTANLTRLYVLALLPLAPATVASAALRARERMDYYLVYTAGGALLQSGGGMLLLLAGMDLGRLIPFLLLAQVPPLLLALGLARRVSTAFSSRTRGMAAATILRRSAPLALLGLVAVLYQRLGVLTLTPLAGEAAAGQFSAALRLAETLKILPYAFYGALFPQLARQTLQSPSSPPLRRALWLLMGSLGGAGLLLSSGAGPLTRVALWRRLRGGGGNAAAAGLAAAAFPAHFARFAAPGGSRA